MNNIAAAGNHNHRAGMALQVLHGRKVILVAVDGGEVFTFQDQGEFIVQMVLWRLPVKATERLHGLKYRLFCGRGSVCIVRYDNENGKGDHRHYGNYEEPYDFESLDKLISDFKSDCTRLAGWKW